MKNKINLKFYLIFSFLLLFMTACMDPVIDKDESYSDFEAFDASDYLNDPNEGFINGGFEEGGLNLCSNSGGSYGFICRLSTQAIKPS